MCFILSYIFFRGKYSATDFGDRVFPKLNCQKELAKDRELQWQFHLSQVCRCVRSPFGKMQGYYDRFVVSARVRERRTSFFPGCGSFISPLSFAMSSHPSGGSLSRFLLIKKVTILAFVFVKSMTLFNIFHHFFRKEKGFRTPRCLLTCLRKEFFPFHRALKN